MDEHEALEPHREALERFLIDTLGNPSVRFALAASVAESAHHKWGGSSYAGMKQLIDDGWRMLVGVDESALNCVTINLHTLVMFAPALTVLREVCQLFGSHIIDDLTIETLPLEALHAVLALHDQL